MEDNSEDLERPVPLSRCVCVNLRMKKNAAAIPDPAFLVED